MESKKNIILAVLGVAIVAVTAYLTNHYFIVKYPTPGISGGAFCDINQFFNCDVTTNSPLSNIAGIPISLFGLLLGVFFFVGALLKNPGIDKTNKLLALINFAGCVVLFLYSLIALGGLCPMCTVYYVLSGVAVFIYWKYFDDLGIDIKAAVAFGIITIIGVVIVNSKVSDKEKIAKNMEAYKKSVIDDYYSYDNLGKPDKDSEYRVLSTTENFADAPIRITLFSDFQCPACKALEKVLPEIKKRYAGHANIQFIFYPLDIECNNNMKRSIGHDSACKASYFAACLPNKFSEIHDDLFENQTSIGPTWLEDHAKKEGVLDCYKDPKTKEKVIAYIDRASSFNIKSTPTLIVNGVKVEGVLPFPQLSIILDEILKRAGINLEK